ncbi:MAG: hypothetical protein V4689_12715 [Verrucomicrobiota bacterium]
MPQDLDNKLAHRRHRYSQDLRSAVYGIMGALPIAGAFTAFVLHNAPKRIQTFELAEAVRIELIEQFDDAISNDSERSREASLFFQQFLRDNPERARSYIDKILHDSVESTQRQR